MIILKTSNHLIINIIPARKWNPSAQCSCWLRLPGGGGARSCDRDISPAVIPYMQLLNGFLDFNSLIIKLGLKYNLKVTLYNQRQNANMIGFPSVYPRHHRASSSRRFVAFRPDGRKSITCAGAFQQILHKTSKHCSLSVKRACVFSTFFSLFCSFFLVLRKLSFF